MRRQLSTHKVLCLVRRQWVKSDLAEFQSACLNWTLSLVCHVALIRSVFLVSALCASQQFEFDIHIVRSISGAPLGKCMFSTKQHSNWGPGIRYSLNVRGTTFNWSSSIDQSGNQMVCFEISACHKKEIIWAFSFNNSHGKKSLAPPIPKLLQFRHHDSLRSLMPYNTHFGTWTMTKYLVAVYLSSSPITVWKTPMILISIIIIFFHYFVDNPSELLGDTVRGLSYTEKL